MNKTRCAWTDGSKLYNDYHDNEWGQPVYDDNKLFEMLVLESFQAGLSWITILKKRDDFRIAFDNFDPNKIIKYDETKITELTNNEKIIRHRGKIEATINNAKIFLEIQEKYGSFSKFIWSYVNDTPIITNPKTINDVPATTPISDKLSKDLKKLGFKFMGSTITYAFMQATGMTNDHTTDCFCNKNNY